MIFARSRRSVVRIGAAALAVAVASGCAALGLLLTHAAATWIALPAGLGAGGVAVTGWLAWRTWRWPDARLCLFRDRLLVVDGRRVETVLWQSIEVATLASGGVRPWTAAGAEVKLGDRLTIATDARTRPISFRPASFGLEPGRCLDLLLELRDDVAAREQLPEFDSALDLRGRPATARELNRPAL